MSDILHNINTVQHKIRDAAIGCDRKPEDIRLVAVSKRFPHSDIIRGIEAGQKLFGENYIQEAAEKYDSLIQDGATPQLHFIGHLQSNKAKTATEIFSMVETVDRLKLARQLNKHLANLNKTLNILIQVNIGRDQNKSGVLPEDTEALLSAIKEENLEQLIVCGLMTIAPFTADPEDARPFFRDLKTLSLKLSGKELFANDDKIELSMGMSNDFHVAIQEGATLVRVGTAIFGQRPELNE